MKTSEVLRSAVDNHLAVSNRRYDRTTHSEYLCWCVIHEFMMPSANPDLDWHIRQLPKKFQDLCGMMSSDLCFSMLYSERGYSLPTNVQELRFMYAEFLALYFEDMGD